jgi:hypothetical protein
MECKPPIRDIPELPFESAIPEYALRNDDHRSDVNESAYDINDKIGSIIKKNRERHICLTLTLRASLHLKYWPVPVRSNFF